jgi:hypothetical protein
MPAVTLPGKALQLLEYASSRSHFQRHANNLDIDRCSTPKGVGCSKTCFRSLQPPPSLDKGFSTSREKIAATIGCFVIEFLFYWIFLEVTPIALVLQFLNQLNV